MSFLSSETLRTAIPANNIIEPFNLDRIRHAAYELAIGAEIFVTGQGRKIKEKLSERKQFIIPAGQTALLLTEEVVNIPSNLIAFLSIKFKIKFQGLVNISGFHVDPGFKGRLKFSVYNAGSNDITLSRGDAVFLIWFCRLDAATRDTYDGTHNGQMEISNSDVSSLRGDAFSPTVLQKRIEKLESKITYIIGTALIIIAGLVMPYLVNSKNQKSSSPVHITVEMPAPIKASDSPQDTIQNINRETQSLETTK